MRVTWMAVALAGLITVVSTPADAQLSVGGQFGYGVGVNTDPDPYRVLVGGRVGWNFDALYLGANVNFYSGEKTRSTSNTTTYYRQLQVLGLDLGYDLDAGPVVVRPVIGFGGAVGIFQVGGRKENDGAGFITFGAETLATLKDLVFLGGGIRFTSSFYDIKNLNGFTFYATAGARFDLFGANGGDDPEPETQ